MTRRKPVTKLFSYSEEVLSAYLNKSRIIFLFEEIEDPIAQEVNRRLVSFDSQNHKHITLFINSPGGSVFAGLSIVDTMNFIKSPITTIIIGRASSMASIISISGKKRLMTENSWWMSHPPRIFNEDYLKFTKDNVDAMERLDNQLNEIYKRYINLTDKDWDKMNNGELWLNAEECFKRKIVDNII